MSSKITRNKSHKSQRARPMKSRILIGLCGAAVLLTGCGLDVEQDYLVRDPSRRGADVYESELGDRGQTIFGNDGLDNRLLGATQGVIQTAVQQVDGECQGLYMTQLARRCRAIRLDLSQLFGEAALPQCIQFHDKVVDLIFKSRQITSHLNKRLFTALDLQGHRLRILGIQCALQCDELLLTEIHSAIDHGARTLDGIKFRSRAGMGRCQGGFCTARCMHLLAERLGQPFHEITKRGGDSWMVTEMTAARSHRAKRGK